MINLNNMTEFELETYARKLLDDKNWSELEKVKSFCNTKDLNKKENFRFKLLLSEIDKLTDNLKTAK